MRGDTEDYYISEEGHVMGHTTIAIGDRMPSVTVFKYAIRRSADHSLVFRAGTYDQAQNLIDRLAVTTAA